MTTPTASMILDTPAPCLGCGSSTCAADHLCEKCFDAWEKWEAERTGASTSEVFWVGPVPAESISAWKAARS